MTPNPQQGTNDAGMSRRSFLGWATAALASLVGLVLGGAGTAYFVSPAFGRKDEDWVDLGPIKDIKPGLPAEVEFITRKRDAWMTTETRASAWVLTGDGRNFTVFDPRCTHLGCPYRWDQGRRQFLCPCHTAVFDVDGKVVSGPPPRPLDRLPVKVVGGHLMVLPAKKTEAT